MSLIEKSSVKLENIVSKKINPVEPNQLSGVYEISLTKEDGTVQFYIEKTSKQLKTRIKEYIADIKYQKKKLQLWPDYTTKSLYRWILKIVE